MQNIGIVTSAREAITHEQDMPAENQSGGTVNCPAAHGSSFCYWVICKAKKENWSPVRGINWIGIIAWVIGGGFALLETLGVVTVFSSALDGVIIAFVAYWILYSLLKNTKLAGSGDMTIEEACSVAQ